MTILEKIKFEEDWLSEVNLTKENIKIALAGIRATVIEQQLCEDCISREQAVYVASGYCAPQNIANELRKLPSVTPKTMWIPVSERLPEDLEPVNITWVNHEPEPYYHDIKDRNFVATGIYYRGQWYWYSTTCADYLGEYGSNEIDKVDDAVEIIAWMPLPTSYQGGGSE